jgi:hypothetical protein
MVKFVLVFFLLGVVDADESHKNVSRVCERANGQTDLLEVGGGAICNALVNNVTVAEEQQSVEVVESLRAGLVDGGDDGFAFFVGESLHDFANVFGHKGIEAASGLVK